MKVTNVVFESGERYPCIVHENGSMDFWSTLYVTEILRQDCKQTTIGNCLYAIVHFKKWEQLSCRKLLKEIKKQQFPKANTISSIKQHCGLSKKALNFKSKKVTNIKKLFKSKSPLDTVSREYQYQRMMYITGYLVFCAREVCKFKPKAADSFEQIESMEKLFKSYYPKGLGKTPRINHAESEDFELFRALIKPTNPQNPFSNFSIRLRNYLLVEILYWTGCRPSEALSLTLDNVEYEVSSPALFFERRHDDPADPRKQEPTLKTQERSVEIPPSLLSDLEYYIRNIRSTFEQRKTHPYIFVSHKGKTSGLPMTDKTFSEKVFQPLKRTNKRFKYIQRRGFRIYFNERFSDNVDLVNARINEQIHEAETKNQKILAKQLRSQLISEGDEINARQIVLGHSSPDSARSYLDRHVERKAKKIHKQMMKDVSRIIKETKLERNR